MNPRLIAHAAVVTLGAALLLTPAFLAGEPGSFPDTKSYDLIGRSIFALVDPRLSGGNFAARIPEITLGANRPATAFTWLAVRSVAYSMWLYALGGFGSMWLVAAAQAWLTSTLIYVTMQKLLSKITWVVFLGAIFLLATLTGGGWFSTMLLPDAFVAIAVLSSLMLLMYWDYWHTLQITALFLVILFSLMCHSTIAPIVTTVSIAWIILNVIHNIPIGKNIVISLVVLSAVTFAFSINAIIRYSEQIAFEKPILTPPFVTARLLEDGTGRVYLHRACAGGAHFVLCNYLDHPLNGSEAFLYSPDPRVGVFTPADPERRIELAREQWPFVTAVVRADPVGVVAAAVGNTLRMALNVSVEDVVGYDAAEALSQSRSSVQWSGVFCRRDGLNPCAPTIWTTVWEWGMRATLLASVTLVVFDLLRPVRTGVGRDDLRTFCLLVIVAVLVNAAICGALADPAASRYNMRLIWLVPFCAYLIVLRRYASTAPSLRRARPSV